MSDLSGISHDYALNADFAGHFNELVMRLKRAFLIGDPINSSKEFISAREEVVQVLKLLIGVIDENREERDAPNLHIPADVIERIRNHNPRQIAGYREQWANLVDEVASSETLSEESFGVLDNICEIADATTSAAFRRLRRF